MRFQEKLTIICGLAMFFISADFMASNHVARKSETSETNTSKQHSEIFHRLKKKNGI
jgi:hypothetical protein